MPPKEKEAASPIVYCLVLDNCTYIGYTLYRKHRLRQHNGELVGGARYTKAHLARVQKRNSRAQWKMLFWVSGFGSSKHALQFERAWKHAKTTKMATLSARVEGLCSRAVVRRMSQLHYLLAEAGANRKWSRKAPCTNDMNLTLHVDGHHKELQDLFTVVCHVQSD